MMIMVRNVFATKYYFTGRETQKPKKKLLLREAKAKRPDGSAQKDFNFVIMIIKNISPRYQTCKNYISAMCESRVLIINVS